MAGLAAQFVRTSRSMQRMSILRAHLQGNGESLGTRASPTLSQVSARNTASAAGDAWFSQCRQIKILDSEMNYYDSAPPEIEFKRNAVVFLHGNPTSSFLWRDVIPHVEGVARCLAPDLIGMGKSAKLPDHSYRFVDHYRYLSAWIENVGLPEKITIVCHDWGSGLGLHWCHQHQKRVKAIVHMEGVVGVMPSWDAFPEIARNIFQSMRSKDGEEIVLKKNMFVERLLPGAIMRDLSEDEMNAYRWPYLDAGEDRRPTLTWPREIPVRTEGPQDVIEIVDAYCAWLSQSKDIPKLYIHAKPGFFSSHIKKVTENWPNHRVETVKGLHFLQEDSPKEIGMTIRDFLENCVYKD